MTAPRTLLRQAALSALQTAASLADSNPDFAPLVGAQVFLGQPWPSQSPTPGDPPLPNQLLIYVFSEDSESLAGETTGPQFKTTAMLVVECRVETRTPAAQATLPSVPTGTEIGATIDARLEALANAAKDAICSGIMVAATAQNGGTPFVQGITKVECQAKITGEGQRIAGNDVLTFDLVYGETFTFLTTSTLLPLTDLSILTGVQAAAVAHVGNAGNGTISAVTVGPGAQLGDFTVTFTSATAFTVTNPDTTSAGTGTVGQVFSGGALTFTITAGTTPFATGDGYAIAVSAVVQTTLDPSA